MSATDSLIERGLYVADRSQQLLEELLPESAAMPVDYLSVFARSPEDYERLRENACELGDLVFQKNGDVYRLRDDDQGLPSRVVRVREPGEPTKLEGCADFVVSDYGAVKIAVMGVRGYMELSKPGYNIIGVSPPDYDVSVYFPSERLTETLMGLRQP